MNQVSEAQTTGVSVAQVVRRRGRPRKMLCLVVEPPAQVVEPQVVVVGAWYHRTSDNIVTRPYNHITTQGPYARQSRKVNACKGRPRAELVEDLARRKGYESTRGYLDEKNRLSRGRFENRELSDMLQTALACGISFRSIADEVGCTREAVRQYAEGIIFPSPDVAMEMYRVVDAARRGRNERSTYA